MIITGKITGYDNLEKVFYQVYYERYNKLTQPFHLSTKKDGNYLNTYNFNTKNNEQLGDLPLLPGDKITLFFWEGEEDKSEILKLSCLDYIVTEDFLQQVDIELLDFSQAIDIKLVDENGEDLKEIRAYKGVPFDFKKYVKFETHFTFKKENGKIFYQYIDTMKFFDWRNYIIFSVKLDDKELIGDIVFDKFGLYNITGAIKVFQFQKIFTLKVKVVEAPPKYSIETDPKIPVIGEFTKIMIKIDENITVKKKLEVYIDDTLVTTKEVSTTGIPDKFAIDYKLSPAFYHILRLEYTYFDGFEDYTDKQEFKIFMKNELPYIQIANKQAVETAGGDTRKLNLYLKSKDAKKVYINWYLKIDENPDWVFLCSVPLLELDDWTEIDDIKSVEAKVISATGKLKLEVVLEDMFGDKASDFVTFFNNCNKFDTANVNLIHSNIFA